MHMRFKFGSQNIKEGTKVDLIDQKIYLFQMNKLYDSNLMVDVRFRIKNAYSIYAKENLSD